MARIRVYKGKFRTTYTATVRVKGHNSVSATFDTKTEAKNWAAQIEVQMRSGRYINQKTAKKISFTEALDKYFDTISSMKSPNSIRRDKDSIKAIKANFNTSLSLADVTPEKIANYRNKRLEKVAPSTVLKELVVISHLFNIAATEWGLHGPRPPVRDALRHPRLAGAGRRHPRTRHRGPLGRRGHTGALCRGSGIHPRAGPGKRHSGRLGPRVRGASHLRRPRVPPFRH